jgi:drug/metabolite transporter (DMT)-like permease
MQSTQGRGGGLGLALVSAIAFGGSGVAAKPLIEAGFEPLHVVWLRVAGAALVLLPVALRHRELPRQRPGLVIGFGLLGIAGCQGLYYLAISRIPVGVAILVEYLGPALLLGWVRFVQRRQVRRAAVLGVALAVGGMCCVVEIWSGLAFAPLGLLFSLGAACCQVAYFVLADQGTPQTAAGAGTDDGAAGRRDAGTDAGWGVGADAGAVSQAKADTAPDARTDAHLVADVDLDADRFGDGEGAPDPVAVIAHGLLIGTASLTLVAHPWDIAWTSLAHQVPLGDRDVPAILLVGWIVLVSTVVSYLTGVVAVRRLTPQIAAVVSCVEAVVGTVLAWFLLGEHLGAAQIVGGSLVLAGAFAAQTAAPEPADGPVADGAVADSRTADPWGTVPEPRPGADAAAKR